jgi:hypothetical protein
VADEVEPAIPWLALLGSVCRERVGVSLGTWHAQILAKRSGALCCRIYRTIRTKGKFGETTGA